MNSESNYNKQYFKFNLIPPLSKEEITVLEKRDNTLLYSFVLIFVGVLIYFGANLFGSFVVQPRLNSVNTDLANTNVEISSFSRIKSINGELFLKTKSLEPILLNDIRISDLLREVDELLPDDNTYNIISYQRENLGTFVINVVSGDFEDAVKLLNLMKDDPSFDNIKLRNIVRISGNTTGFIIAFSLISNGNTDI